MARQNLVPADASVDLGEHAAGLAPGLSQIVCKLGVEETAHLVAKGFVSGAQGQVHRHPPVISSTEASGRPRPPSRARLTAASDERYGSCLVVGVRVRSSS